VTFAIRVSIVLTILVPALVRGWLSPWWQMLAIAFVAFGLAEGVALWLRSRASEKRERAVLALAITALVGATAAALFAGGAQATQAPSDGEVLTYREIDEVLSDGSDGVVRVHGVVRPGSFQHTSSSYEFVLEGSELGVTVRAQGVPPMALREHAEAVVIGQLAEQGGTRVLSADQVLVMEPQF
jgi:cytochrome c-type biogenesis protein CcmE